MFLLLCCSLSLLQTASQPSLALARVEAVVPPAAKAGGTLKLTVRVTPREGIHIYAPPQKDFKPVSLTVEGAPRLKVGKPVYPPAVTRTFEGDFVKVYDRTFSIAVPVVLPQDATGTTWVSGKLVYQACDDLICYRPVTTAVRWDIQLQ